MIGKTIKPSIVALLVWLLQLSHFPASSFTPMVPPRFDNFGEQLVGTWSNGGVVVGDVEEVMRSCGGAVQGIREVPFFPQQKDDNESEGLYHNRADDGFVYFDCGSYTRGPVKVNGNANEEINAIVGSVSFATLPKARVIFSTTNHDDDDNDLPSWQSLIRTNKKVVEGEREVLENQEEEVSTIDRSAIQWNKYMICSKPSPNQPWMLQRCKYEKIVLENAIDDSNNMKQSRKMNANDAELRGWVDIIEFNGNDDKITDAAGNDIWGCSDLDTLLLNGTSRIVQLGAVCLSTGDVKALIRCYDDEQVLKAVILQHGILPS